ncbi:hypothetical protein DJ39_3404 [Yersinia ruckeri ATCC 29473]|nr:hypothetical protein DJ39_3404 [Yersinia ruckeri ATCC 29473]
MHPIQTKKSEKTFPYSDIDTPHSMLSKSLNKHLFYVICRPKKKQNGVSLYNQPLIDILLTI